MSQSPLSRLAGPFALAAGAVFVTAQLLLLVTLDVTSKQATVGKPIFVVSAALLAPARTEPRARHTARQPATRGRPRHGCHAQPCGACASGRRARSISGLERAPEASA